MSVCKFFLYLLFPCIFFSTPGAAQQTYPFTKGLVVVAETNYGREAVYKDQLAWQLYTGSLKAPVEGGLFGMDEGGRPVYWKGCSADSLNRFPRRMPGRREGAGYLYLNYSADRARRALLHITGDGSFFFNGVPHAGDPYSSGWLYIPVSLKKGLNELYVRVSGQVTASLVFPSKDVQLNTEDPTLPVILAGAAGNDSLQGAVVVINNSPKALQNCRIMAVVNGKSSVSAIPSIPSMSTRKVSFFFNGTGIAGRGHFDGTLTLLARDRTIDEKKMPLEAVGPGESYSVTFHSGIDGSLQYYAVTPQKTSGGSGAPGGSDASVAAGADQIRAGQALFLSVHGAGVEAIGQARAYHPKDWGTLVAATNRRPRGFNWEDWGRIDALEVLSLAEKKFSPDPQHIYLTGHSMGGHGTWFLGAAYPDKWAAIGACSGYPTLKDYGSHDGVVPDTAASPIGRILLRASDQSDVIQLATNYKPFGVYILHGDSDKVVPVTYARQMRKVLAAFHSDMSYHEVPGAGHWYGNQSVDWGPLFDFFKWHIRKPDSLVGEIDFRTASPGISATYRWATIWQQLHPLAYSRVQLTRDVREKTIMGQTENIRLLLLSLADFGAGTGLTIRLDGGNPVEYTTTGAHDSLFLLRTGDHWEVAARPDPFAKSPHRYGTLKDAFVHNMVFVYGTTGNEEENRWSFEKARYDAETWYYRGNGAVDIISDKEFSLNGYAGRNVILFGNASTNAAWPLLLANCPIQVQRGKISAGALVWQGDSLGVYFVWPLSHSTIGSVAVIGGTGLKGMEAANANQYFAGASGFPDFMVFDMSMLRTADTGVRFAGFFDNDWKLSKAEWEVGEAEQREAGQPQAPATKSAGSYVPILPADSPADIIRKAAHVVPSPRQLRWQELELTAFFHFGINTFTDREWGDGKEDPSVFNPTRLDARQWIRVAKAAGIRQVILTAKHHDGFCLWPSQYTEHTIKNTPYKNGHGDIVKEFADACKEYGMGFGIYLSPWDRNSADYGDSAKYNDLFLHWLTELLTNYGKVDEIWFDGANGEGPNGKKQVYAFEAWYHLIRRLQPQAVIANLGPDVRWVGTETGQGRLTEWSVLPVNANQQASIAANSQKDMTFAPIGDLMSQDLGSRQQLMAAKGLIWYPAETDVSIRPGWFYHDNEDAKVRSPAGLMDLYFSSVGRNSLLLLNIPPNREGLISDADIRSLKGWRKDMDSTFGINLAVGAAVASKNGLHPRALLDGNNDTWWTTTGDDTTATITFALAGEKTFDVLALQEEIRVGQRVEKFVLEYPDHGQWKEIASGTTIGYKRLIRFPPVTTRSVRLRILSSRLNPTIAEFGLYKLVE